MIAPTIKATVENRAVFELCDLCWGDEVCDVVDAAGACEVDVACAVLIEVSFKW